jgi:hypothetical protein
VVISIETKRVAGESIFFFPAPSSWLSRRTAKPVNGFPGETPLALEKFFGNVIMGQDLSAGGEDR